MADNYFARVPATVRQDRRLTDFDLRVFVELAAYCNTANECWYSNSKIAENVNKHNKSVSRSISRLAEYGHISLGEKRPGLRSISIVDSNLTVTSGNHTVTGSNPTVTGSNPTVTGGQPYGYQGSNPTVNQKDLEFKKEKRRIHTQGVVDSDFETFWKEYPRKAAKGSALKAWAKTKDIRPGLPELLEIIAFWKTREAWTKDGGRFIPHPASWLNGQRWEDDRTNAAQDENARAAEIYKKMGLKIT